MCCNSIIQVKKKKKSKTKRKTDYLAFSLLTPEYFKALRLQYYVLGTTGLDQSLVHQFSREALPKVLAFPPKCSCCEPRLPCLEGLRGAEREPGAALPRHRQWKHTL